MVGSSEIKKMISDSFCGWKELEIIPSPDKGIRVTRILSPGTGKGNDGGYETSGGRRGGT